MIALTGVAAGLELAGVLGAVGLAWGVGHTNGTGIYEGYCLVAY